MNDLLHEGEGLTFKEVFDSLTKKKRDVLYYLIGQLTEEGGSADTNLEQSALLSEEEMTVNHNIFETSENGDPNSGTAVLTHEDFQNIFSSAKRKRSTFKAEIAEFFRENLEGTAVHETTYGIDNYDLLFPDAKAVDGQAPYLLSEDLTWVGTFLGMCRKSPFSRIKSLYADITADEARAKGYIRQAEKFEEVFPIFSRVTTPQTIYKKQKLDHDDIIDITGFDVVMWLKSEMRMMLRAELAQAILVGDGRLVSDPDKIKTENIRPIYQDADIYTHKVEFIDGTDDILDVIDGITGSREHYRGSGNPTLFISPGTLTQMLVVRDADDRRIYPTEETLKAALRVNKILEVPAMTGITRDDATDRWNLVALLVNPTDYIIGADKGGETSFFNQFDIDFNQEKYLYETRSSGALVKPKSALQFEYKVVGGA